MKHYILNCVVSSSKLPGKGSLGDPKRPMIFSEKEVSPIEANLPFLIATKKIEEYPNEEIAKFNLKKRLSVDVEFIETEKPIIKEEIEIISEPKQPHWSELNDDVIEELPQEQIVEELTKEELAQDAFAPKEKKKAGRPAKK